MRKVTLNYDPHAYNVLKQMNDAMHEYAYQMQKPLTDGEKNVFIYAWREALLYAVDELRTLHTLISNHPNVSIDPHYAVNQLAYELIKDNALAPFISTQQ